MRAELLSAGHFAISPPRAAGSAFTRGALFLAIFTVVFLTLRPFTDLRQNLAVEPAAGNDTLTYFVFFALAVSALALARRHAAPALAALKTPALLALAGWIVLSALISYDPATSLKRAVLCVLVAATAAAAPLLPRGRHELGAWLAAAVAFPVALSYFAVLFLPDLAIHSLADTLEPELAGDWRGVFAHKNIASPMFGLSAFIGLYLAGTGRARAGAAITLASLVFLVFTGGKTATALWLPAGLVGVYVARRPSGFLGRALVLGPPIAISALGFGAQLSPALARLSATLPFDSSFTGRADVWRFVAEKMKERLIAGRGFDAFWDDTSLRANAEQGWVAGAAHAHNGFVDITLSMGLIGLAFTLWALVFAPFADLGEAARRGADPALRMLCAAMLVYGLWASSLETFLFDRANPVWFLLLFAVFTLRYLACFRVAP